MIVSWYCYGKVTLLLYLSSRLTKVHSDCLLVIIWNRLYIQVIVNHQMKVEVKPPGDFTSPLSLSAS